MTYTIKEIGSGWDVRNLYMDQPIVTIKSSTGDTIIDEGWELNESQLNVYGTHCYTIDLTNNQPTAFNTCSGGGLA